jgi:GNAT superfamily N-acetyltransferase
VSEAELRRARVEDAEAIARVHLRSWQSAYRHVFPPDLLDALPLEPRIRGWNEGLQRDEAAGDPVVGFVFGGPSADEAGVGEIEAIYLDAAVWGTGVGRRLLAAAEDALLANGLEEAILWVIEDNPRARRFYEAAGWHVDGGRKSWPRMGAEPQVVRYRKRLSP